MSSDLSTASRAGTSRFSQLCKRVQLGKEFVGAWRVDHLLALGAMAVVYEVTHETGVRGALKICADEGEGSTARFRREVTLTELAAEAGAPKLLAHGVREDGMRYLILELIGGRTLEHHWAARGHRIDAITALTLTERLLGALQPIHELGIVHRDLDPSNVLITNHGAVRILDFGLATRSGHTLDCDRRVHGAPSFVPPEQARGSVDPLDPGVDVFAVGAILYALLCGDPPRSTPPEIDERFSGPFAALELLEIALAEQPGRRFASASAMRRAVRAVLDEYGGIPLAAAP